MSVDFPKEFGGFYVFLAARSSPLMRHGSDTNTPTLQNTVELISAELMLDDTVTSYLAVIFMGVVLGILGGGGSVLTVPILVYLCKVEPILASSYSLWIVSFASLFGAFRYALNYKLPYDLILIFGAPSVLGVVLARAVLLPNIPDEIANVAGTDLTKDLLILLLFALLMIAAGAALIYQKDHPENHKFSIADKDSSKKIKVLPLILEGIFTGVITGLVGAGGGFMIVPVLVILVGLPMKMAVGTSLAIISLKSFSGILADATFWQNANWQFLIQFTIAAVIGILLGSLLANKLPARRLKVGFGWFVLSLGIYILIKELVLSRYS